MARMIPEDHMSEIATVTNNSRANFLVEMGGTSKVEVWDRILPCKPGAPAPDFGHRLTLDSDDLVQMAVPTGDIYQVRLFNVGNGNRLGIGPILGKLDFPCVVDEDRSNFLTACAEVPQINIVRGGTFVSMDYFGSTPTCCRLQLAVAPPDLDGFGLPFFPPETIVASNVVSVPALLNRVSAVDELLQPDTHLHAPMRTDQDLYFVLFVWNEYGTWDMVWNTTGIASTLAPGTPQANLPETIKTLKRVVNVQLDRLLCLNDADPNGTGEGKFDVIFQHPGGELRKTLSFNVMDSGKPLTLPPPGVSYQINHPDSAGTVGFRVEGTELDGIGEDDEYANAPLTGILPLPYPRGEKQETVSNAKITAKSQPVTVDSDLSFEADVVYSVRYV